MAESVDKTTPRLCLRCFKHLQKIGHARKNGARHHGDWDSREYHKACWKAMQRQYFGPTNGGRRKPFKAFKKRRF